MGLINKDRFVDLLVAEPLLVPDRHGYVGRSGGFIKRSLSGSLPGMQARLANVEINRESALAVFDEIKQYIMRTGYVPGKSLRPWDIDSQLYSNLDRGQAWWGFEFETGYQSVNERAEVIEHVWDNFDNVVFDTEGEGNAAVEITFTPRPMSEYLDGTADATKFMRYLEGNPRVMKTNEVSVGTHINISHPQLVNSNLRDVVYSLNRTLAALPFEIEGVGNVREFMFGRPRLYGGFFQQVTETAVWTEGKLFRTAYDMATYERYIKVCKALTDVLELLCNTPYENPGKGPVPYVNNLYEMAFDGAAPELQFGPHLGTLDGLRSNDAINGVYGRKVAGEPLAVGEVNMLPAWDDEADDEYDGYYEHDDDDYCCEECNGY